jgi:sialate O-acetylesterase
MVLQRDMPIRIWGTADPAETISVTLGGAFRKTTVGLNRNWSVTLPAMSAGGPFTLEIRGQDVVRFKDVMVGEVWVASGQSNMTYALSGAATGPEALQNADDPELRLFTVPKRIALTNQPDTLAASWQPCTRDTAKEFSAVAYFFARGLRQALHVPVGVILSAWPGTAAEEWTPPEALKTEPELQPIEERWKKASPAEKAFAMKGRSFSLEFDDFELVSADPAAASVVLTNFDEGSSQLSTGGNWSYSWPGAPNSTFALVAPGRGNKGYAARLSGWLDGASDARWEMQLRPHSGTDLSAYAGIRFWVRGNGSFVFQSLQPSITDWDNYTTGILEAAREWKQVTVPFGDLKQQGWGVRQHLTLGEVSGFSITVMTDLGDPPRPPSGLFYGMIAPLVRYPIRGAIWYQGEGNTQRAFQYRTLLPSLIKGWRKAWQETELPFLIVQLPNQGHSEEFADSWWAELREAQLFTMKSVPHTGLAVTIDVGEADNLHPPRKEEIGSRLALCALGTAYGKKLEYSGPLYGGMTIENGEVRILFTHVGAGLDVHGEYLQGFAIAGADKKFHRATARIEGDTVVVSNPDVGSPVAVRYAWADSPDCNLFNKDGLPASPFRTDDWPGATLSNR